ncbi:DUF4371 domain-containing protein [Trichonephila clavipes]|nr:DUF4371 domain-containing protein [Trichonephila clavipes]
MAPADAALPTSALRYQVGGVYDAILAVCNNSEIDNSIRVEASGLLGCVKQFKFLCCIVIWDLGSDTAFNEMLCDARELADEIDIRACARGVPNEFRLTRDSAGQILFPQSPAARSYFLKKKGI